MPREISSATSLDNLKKEAKRWLNALRAGEADARARFARAHPGAPSAPGLRDVQHALAREHGLPDWNTLKAAVMQRANDRGGALALRDVVEYGRLAQDFVAAFESRDEAALARLNGAYQRSFTFDDLWAEVWRRVYAFRERAFKDEGAQRIEVAEAQMLIAQDAGFQSWGALEHAAKTGAPPIPPYEIDTAENVISPRRRLTMREWDALLDVMRERRITGLAANGLMTDEVMARVARLEHVTRLALGGSRELSDKGLLHLSQMPQVEALDLSEYPGGKLTDRGLEALRHLSNLRAFEMTWQRGISDAGIANLRYCDRLERVNLMGSPTGDGAIEALQGKPRLARFSTGRLVTDAGLALLKNFPLLKELHQGMEGHLLIDGPFTDEGLAGLAGLAGVVDLDLFWHVTALTSEGFRHLAAMANLMSLGADGKLSDDTAMRHFAAIPRLQRLRAQEAAATDAGFEALATSPTLEFFWGRECAGFSSRAFVAFSKMPRLRGMGVSCANVDAAALAEFEHFPALEELTPIGVQDPGFRHIGRCQRLTRLTCMYCRDTTDVATEYIKDLRIKYYYAGLTKITDRSLAILGGMDSLEQIEFYECTGITDGGLSFLARLPGLREVHIDSSPGVTLQGTRVFPPHVRVKYST
jgi:hypothetical protein